MAQCVGGLLAVDLAVVAGESAEVLEAEVGGDAGDAGEFGVGVAEASASLVECPRPEIARRRLIELLHEALAETFPGRFDDLLKGLKISY